ncbi:MAG: hypothetical protein AAF480_03195 [Actinomycetota bacterium]
MGKASSAKKVARAARVGASSGPTERRQLGFPALVVIVIVLGLALVAFARTTRDAQAAPTLQDHWHSAYGVYDCRTDSFLPDFQSERDPDGIHSHQDGLIHIHPFTAGVTGREAKLSVFLTNMGASLTDSELTLPGNETLAEGVECDGEEAILQVVRWSNVIANSTPSEIITEDLDQTRFLEDGEGFVIALAPEGADIPLPQSLDQLAAVTGQSRDEGVEPPNTTAIPGPQDFGTQDGGGDADE